MTCKYCKYRPVSRYLFLYTTPQAFSLKTYRVEIKVSYSILQAVPTQKHWSSAVFISSLFHRHKNLEF